MLFRSTFMRFQEYYESPNPNFRGKTFTRGEYLSWYSKERGYNSYSSDWSGYNFPSYVLTPFKCGQFDPLTDKELEFLNFFKYRHDNFYIIGANDDSVIRHELSHALYYTNSNYYREINAILDSYHEELDNLNDHLITMGYCVEVLYDEIQAYITEGCSNYIVDNAPKHLVNDIMAIFDKYSTQ